MKTAKPRILFYCQHSLGMGHLVRSLGLAEGLASKFDVVLLNGGRLPEKMRLPQNIEIVNLPPLAFDKNNQLVSCEKRRSVENAKISRKKIILEKFKTLKPDIVLIELFPFGRKKFSDELLPLLEQAKSRAKIVCSLRDILVGNRRDQERFEEKAISTANKYFDAVLVHSDKTFAKFEDSLKTKLRLKIPIFYTGFVVANSKIKRSGNRSSLTKKIIVSAGGGVVGETLLRTAIEAHKILSQSKNIETRIIAGLFLPKEIFQKLKDETCEINNLNIVRFVQNLRGAMAESDVSVSQCGYNTAFDILLSGVSGIVVPFDAGGEDEQMIRAGKLENSGLLKVLNSKNLTAKNLAKEIEKSLTFQPKEFSLDIGGRENSAKYLGGILPAPSKAKTKAEKSWLESIRRSLEASGGGDKVRIFFRDDDAGIGSERLFRLLDIFEKFKIPLDLAVIPKAVTKDFAQKLTVRIKNSKNLFSIHQHGFAHTNHEREGRKCEFGKSRSKEKQFTDISTGKNILGKHFGKAVQPIFTPPWNRCSNVTAEVLSELGFKILAREARAETLDVKNLREISVSIDWFAKRRGIFLERKHIGEMIAEKIVEANSFGIMLHHAEMNEEEFCEFENLCEMLTQSRRVKFVSMMDLPTTKKRSFSAQTA